MELRKYIDSYPRRMRMGIRQMIADAHGVSEVTVRAWANGTRTHPCSLAAIEITESVTAGKVNRHDLRPDVFGHGAGQVRDEPPHMGNRCGYYGGYYGKWDKTELGTGGIYP